MTVGDKMPQCNRVPCTLEPIVRLSIVYFTVSFSEPMYHLHSDIKLCLYHKDEATLDLVLAGGGLEKVIDVLQTQGITNVNTNYMYIQFMDLE